MNNPGLGFCNLSSISLIRNMLYQLGLRSRDRSNISGGCIGMGPTLPLKCVDRILFCRAGGAEIASLGSDLGDCNCGSHHNAPQHLSAFCTGTIKVCCSLSTQYRCVHPLPPTPSLPGYRVLCLRAGMSAWVQVNRQLFFPVSGCRGKFW
jgi:hypothetical protein